jgi:hypothetical protein
MTRLGEEIYSQLCEGGGGTGAGDRGFGAGANMSKDQTVLTQNGIMNEWCFWQKMEILSYHKFKVIQIQWTCFTCPCLPLCRIAK